MSGPIEGTVEWAWEQLYSSARRPPCTVLIAQVLQQMVGYQRGRVRHELDVGGPWWRQMNVWYPASPWSMPATVYHMKPPEGAPYAAHMWEAGERSQLAPGRWYACQGWVRLPRPGDPGEGHAWLMKLRPGEGSVDVLESSEALGMRASVDTLVERLARYSAGVRGAALWPVPDYSGVTMGKKIKIPWKDIRELAGQLLASGVDKDDIPAIIGDGLDEIIDFDAMINGPAEVLGDLLEGIDGMIFTQAARLILNLIPAPRLIAEANAAREARVA